MTENTDYRVLARKYRPDTFESLIGQDALVRTLSNAIENNRIAHAFLLTGIRGVGKTTSARIIAKALNCIGEDGQGKETIEPCGKCENCQAIAEGRHTDILEIDAASHTGVNDIREIIDNSRYLPNSARYKIYIIDEVHMLSNSAFNALLKTLEEPPAHVKFIFATTEIRKIPVTVLSRCQRFDLRRVDPELLSGYLKKICDKENAEIDDDALLLIATASEGSVRDSLSLLDHAISYSHAEGKSTISVQMVRDMLGIADKNGTFDLLESVFSGDVSKALGNLRDLYNQGNDPILIVQDALEVVNLITRIKLVPNVANSPQVSELEAKRSKEFSEKLSTVYLARIWQIMLKGLQEAMHAPNALSAVEMLIVRLGYISDMPSPEELIKKIKSGDVKSSPNKNSASTPTDSPASTAVDAVPENAEVSNFQELVQLFATKRELSLYRVLYDDMHLVRFKKGVIEVNLKEEISKEDLRKINEFLNEWTGERWMITISNESGQPTLYEQELAAKKKEHDKLMENPKIKEVKAIFPDADVIEIRKITN